MPTDSAPTDSAPLTVLVDGECPFCVLERRWLERLDARRSARAAGRGRQRAQGLAFVDIAAPEFDASTFGLDRARVHGTIHAVTADGRVLEGMDVFRAAYAAVGLGWLLAPTGWPLLRPLADLGYRLFARYRVRLGRLFGRRCDDDRCRI